jgi:hypothetical protein
VIGSAFFALLKVMVEEVPGFETALERWDLTLPILAVAIGAATAYVGRARRAAVAVGAVLALLGLLVLSPVTVPFLEDRLAEIPVLTPVRASGVIGPIMLLLVLTRLPGGIGQLVRPVQHWLRGNRWDWSVGRVKEVQITDVRA